MSKEFEEEPVEQAPSGVNENAERAADDLQARLEEAEATAEKERDRALRLAAEMDNVRRRTARDLDSARRYGHERFASELLPVADSLELALGSADEAPDAVREGLEMTLKLLHDIFANHHIEVIDPVGEPFDPDFHEAMTTQPSSDVAPDHVLSVVQKGYKLHDRLLRPARVIVSKAPEA